MKKISELELKEILEAHEKWLYARENGKKADLSFTDLSNMNLTRVNLASADLTGADLTGACLASADLSYTILVGAKLHRTYLGYADLTGADLTDVILSETVLKYANLSGIRTDKNFYQVGGVGSVDRTVSYFVKDDIIICGCWKNGVGGTLEEFKIRIDGEYGEYGTCPDGLFYGEYQDVIKFFESRRKFVLQNENLLFPY